MTVEGQDDARKIVTVLFADVTDSTLLGRELDPESVRRMMSRYFEAVSSALERHGGVVEKFIGDAVMAVFGVPRVHEDDALRAVRAAVEVRDVLRELNEEFERAWGVTVPIRTGVNTGEVIAGDPSRGQSFVVGDVVNMAARLEQAASAGEILIGEATYRLVREAVTAEQLPPLTVKGRAEPLQAWSVLGVVPGAPGWSRRLDSPLVDRIRELAMLEEMFERTAKTSSPHVVTAMGVAGVGKSRLTSEFLSRIRDRSVAVTGQCLPYGEGTTFWPVVSMLREVAQIAERDPPHEVSRKLAELLPAEPDGLVADRLAALLGAAPANPGIQETFWALRRLFESLGSDRPLVVVFDDVQWGETTFLDLLEYLADWIKDVPVLLVCLARPELHEVRPGWMTAKSNATSITLQPLSEAETDGLIQNLVGRAELVDEARKHIADVAEGNPLFVEETLRMLVDDGLLRPEEGGWRVAGQLTGITIPPTIHALLSARLDRLEPEERAVLERAAVVGRVFSWSAISELLQPDARRNLIAHLQALTRKELIRPDYSEARGEDAFRFAHILIRDAAYQGIRKATRAELHERLADWLATTSGDRAAEYDEIVGHHLERAHRLLLELGPITERVEELGRRAAAALGAAGRRAFARGDMPAAIALLSRATSLLDQQDRERVELLPQLAFALLETGDFDRLQEVVADATRGAAELGDPALEARAVILGLWVRLWTNPEGWVAEAQAEAARAIAVFEEIGDEEGLAKGWSLLALVHGMNARFASAEHAWRRSALHAQRAGDRRDELESLSWVPLTVWAGPTHAEEGMLRCREVVERVKEDKKALSSALVALAVFDAGLGRFDEARDLVARAKTVLQEVALTVWLAGPIAQFAGWVELLAGDPAAAERELRWGYDKLREIGELSWLSTVAGILAEAVYLQGRYDEAEELTRVSEETAGTEDVYSQVLWRSVRAKRLARRGETDEADRLAQEAVELAEGSDFAQLRWFALLSRAEVLSLVGKTEEVEPLLRDAAALAERKGSVVAARAAASLHARLVEPLQI